MRPREVKYIVQHYTVLDIRVTSSGSHSGVLCSTPFMYRFLPIPLPSLTALSPVHPQHHHLQNTQFWPCQASAHVLQGVNFCRVLSFLAPWLSVKAGRPWLTFLTREFSKSLPLQPDWFTRGLPPALATCAFMPLPRLWLSQHQRCRLHLFSLTRFYLCLTHFFLKTALR